MQVTGTIVKIKPTETIPSKTGGKDFVKREFWLQLADEKYPQTVPFELAGEKTDIIDAYQEGQEITVEFNLRGRIWQDKCFGSLSAWRILKGGDGESTTSSTASYSSAPQPAGTLAPAFEKNVNDLLESASDDLPF
jgi:single-strand DNA-binding protein